MRAGSGTLLLLMVDLIDELCTGAPSLGAPQIRGEFSLAFGKLSLLLLAVPLATSLCVEAPLLLLAAKRGGRHGVSYALAGQALAFALAACARGPWLLLFALSAAILATSVACALAQARLVALHPEQPERILVRWTFMGALGDIAAPLLFAALQRVHGGFRSAFVCCGVLCLAHTALLRLGLPADDVAQPVAEEEPATPPLRAARTQRTLLIWAVATMLCNLLDEIFLVFGSIHLHERCRFDAATTDLVLFALAAGSVLGIGAVERWLASANPLRVLLLSCCACIASFVLWLQLTNAWASAAAMFILGASIGPQFPLAQAQCYRCARGRPLLVNVLESFLEPIHAVLPWIVGALADRIGLHCALCFLLLQPLSILLAMWLSPPPTAAERESA